MRRMTEHRRSLIAVNQLVLPSWYQRVEYLESTGTQWINTEYKANPLSAMRVTLQQTSVRDSITGATGGSTARFVVGIGSALTYYWGLGSVNHEGSFYPSPDVAKHTMFVDAKNKHYGIDNHVYSFSGSMGTSPNVVDIFARSASDTGAPTDYFYGKIFSVIITEDDVKKRFFIPCYRKSDSKPGMYDLVYEVFCTNAGTGEFIVGPDV